MGFNDLSLIFNRKQGVNFSNRKMIRAWWMDDRGWRRIALSGVCGLFTAIKPNNIFRAIKRGWRFTSKQDNQDWRNCLPLSGFLRLFLSGFGRDLRQVFPIEVSVTRIFLSIFTLWVIRSLVAHYYTFMTLGKTFDC